MRYELCLVSLLFLADLTGTAQADMRADPAEAPLFSSTDAGIIARNDVLSAIVEQDPWLVRRILDLASKGGGAAFKPPADAPPNAEAAESGPERRDALGSVEWIKLLKRAKVEKQAQSGSALPEPRSALESVRWLELVKAAKAAKQALP